MTDAPFSTRRVPRCHLGVSIPTDVGEALATHCAGAGISKSLYTEIALRRALAHDAATHPAPTAPTAPPPTTAIPTAKEPSQP